MPDDIFADGWTPEQDPFDEDRDLVPRYSGSEEYRNLLHDMGAYDVHDLVIPESDASAEGQRGQRFETPEEAAQWLYDTGLLAFSRVVRYRYEDDQLRVYYAYGVDVGDSAKRRKR